MSSLDQAPKSNSKEEETAKTYGWIELLQKRKFTYVLLIQGVLFFMTIAAVLVSINADVFKQYDNSTLKKYNFKNPLHILKFAVDQQTFHARHQADLIETEIKGKKELVKFVFVTDVTGSVKVKDTHRDEMIKSLMANKKASDIRFAENFELISNQGIMTLSLVGEVFSNDNFDNEAEIAFVRGKSTGNPITRMQTGLSRIDDDFLSEFILHDTIKNKNGTETDFTKILSNQIWKDLFIKSDSFDKLVITLISDFEQDSDCVTDGYLDSIQLSLVDLRESIKDAGDVVFNLVSLDLDGDSSVFRTFECVFQDEFYFYHYPFDSFVGETDKLIPQIIIPPHFIEGLMDKFLNAPDRTKRISIRKNLSEYSNTFEVEGNENGYLISSPYDLGCHTSYFVMNDKTVISGPERVERWPKVKTINIAKGEKLKFIQRTELEGGYKFSDVDIVDLDKKSKVRLRFWQVEPMTESGSFYYTICIIGAFITLLTFFLSLIYSQSKKYRFQKIIEASDNKSFWKMFRDNPNKDFCYSFLSAAAIVFGLVVIYNDILYSWKVLLMVLGVSIFLSVIIIIDWFNVKDKKVLQQLEK